MWGFSKTQFGFIRGANVGFSMALVEAKSPALSCGVNVDVLCTKSVRCSVLSNKCPSSVAQRGLSTDLGLGGHLKWWCSARWPTLNCTWMLDAAMDPSWPFRWCGWSSEWNCHGETKKRTKSHPVIKIISLLCTWHKVKRHCSSVGEILHVGSAY